MIRRLGVQATAHGQHSQTQHYQLGSVPRSGPLILGVGSESVHVPAWGSGSGRAASHGLEDSGCKGVGRGWASEWWEWGDMQMVAWRIAV